MSISDLPLSYCTNVHPGRTLDEVIANLERYAVPVAERYGQPMGVGLWFAQSALNNVDVAMWPPIADQRLNGTSLPRLTTLLAEHDLSCYTLNAFPFGNFHDRRVKERVYEPNWATDARQEYTIQCMLALRGIMTADSGSISTLPLGFKRTAGEDYDTRDDTVTGIMAFADVLKSNAIRLAIEPEPCCILETTDEAIRFLTEVFEFADQIETGQAAREHIGLCYDICHQAVEFEEPEDSIARIHDAGIRINKVQISNAIEVKNPRNNEAALLALRDYVDERYLHQTFGLDDDGRVHRVVDLTHDFLDDPGEHMLGCHTWRIHYHVPVNQKTIGVLGTTQDHVRRALAAIAKLPYAPHLEVETYTWNVLPGEQPDLVAGIADEMIATRKILDDLRA